MITNLWYIDIIHDDIKYFLEEAKKGVVVDINFKSLFPYILSIGPHSTRYQSPFFQNFERSKYDKEHIHQFIGDLVICRKAYSWYIKFWTEFIGT